MSSLILHNTSYVDIMSYICTLSAEFCYLGKVYQTNKHSHHINVDLLPPVAHISWDIIENSFVICMQFHMR